MATRNIIWNSQLLCSRETVHLPDSFRDGFHFDDFAFTGT